MSRDAVQHLPPAPTLPSVLDPTPADAPRNRSGTAKPPPGDAVARARDFAERIAAAHQAYLSTGLQLHRGFLALWQTTAEALTQAIASADPGHMEVTPDVPAASVATTGLTLDRRDLVTLSCGRISSVFGDLFARQDGHAHQMRPAKPPLLITDRVTRLEGVPGSMGKGSLWSEIDVTTSSWYLDDAGRMPSSVLAEGCQAHIVLLSWLGADWRHHGELVYRTIGSEVTPHGELPKAGETCAIEIHVEGHALVEGSDLFFVRCTCWVAGERRATLKFQSGLFSPDALSAAKAIAWSPAADERHIEEQFDPAPRCSDRRAFTREQVAAFADGRPFDCFGAGFERANAHVRTPKITAGRLRQIDEIESFEPDGGPWRRGYLRAAMPIAPDAWFFDAHFHDDPCLPGFIMMEGGLQAMACYLAALGFTIDRDGWRFEPVPATYTVTFRGQVTPGHHRITFEVFVESIAAAPEPTLVADVVISANGRGICHVRRVRLRLVPDAPLEFWQHLGPPSVLRTGALVPLSSLGGLAGHVESADAASWNGLGLGLASVMAGAWGRPSKSMGPALARFDRHRRMPRLPGPPFLFISRITRLEATQGQLVPGTSAEFAYDVPERAWYFEQHGAPAMPFVVLLEAMLQPCGWLSMFTAAPLGSLDGSLFRNLDGTGVISAEVLPTAGTLRTRARLASSSQLGNVCLVSFDVEAFVGADRVAACRAGFGFFPLEAFHDQAGLPVSADARRRAASDGALVVDLTSRPDRYCAGSAQLAGPMLLMIDRVTAFDPNGGPHGLGYVRAEKDIESSEWFFKAHFYQDPVQPGSLGLESLGQLLQFYLIERTPAEALAGMRFETLLHDRPITWKYRGQVVPESRRITTEIVVTEVGRTAQGAFAAADGWLWVDGVCIYQVTNLAVGLVATVVPR